MVSTRRSSRSSATVNSRSRSRSAGVTRLSFRAASFEQAPAQVFLEPLPGPLRLAKPGLHGGQDGAHGFPGAGAFQSGEGNPEPGRIQALDCEQQLVSCLRVLPLGGEIARKVVEAQSGVGMAVREHTQADRQRLFKQRLRKGVLPLRGEVYRNVAVGGRTQGVVVGEQATFDLDAFSYNGWAWACFPWVMRLTARLL